MNTPTNVNRLQKEASLYLRQHAYNPIDWFPWGKEAFEKAQTENKMMLISIGYSSCHWCHVMEREVFENEQAAAYLNQHFVCVKVDREERPDVDHVYMTAVQLMTQSGGWPLNCFTLPDGRPIYGGTYFPQPQFVNILTSLQKIFSETPQEMHSYASNMEESIKKADFLTETSKVYELDKLHYLVEKWASLFDWNDGGTKRAPKFPLPNNYDFLLSYGQFFGEEAIVEFVHLTLHKICRGGIFDHVGGGLMRYSVDMYWKEPHFEKMLYDNGQFLSVIAKAYCDQKSLEYEFVLKQTVNWLEEKMKTGQGLYRSSIDADSDGEEGSFYCWKLEELRSLFKGDFERLNSLFEINGNGFWKDGNYILLRMDSFTALKEEWQLSTDDFWTELYTILNKLKVVRDERIAPVIDDKVIFSWNCMIAIGFIDVAIALDDLSYYEKALDLYKSLSTYLKVDSILRINDEKNQIDGFLDDYVYWLELQIKLHQYTLEEKYLNAAISTIGFIEKQFEKQGSLFYYSKEDELVLAKTVEINDNVIPASNSILANAYWDLGVLLSNTSYLEHAKAMLNYVYEGMDDYGSGYSNWARLLQKALIGDVSVNYLGEIDLIQHRSFLQKVQSFVMFKLTVSSEHKKSYQICHRQACHLPKDSFDNFLLDINDFLSSTV